jgi:hypothetical protein
VYVPELTNPQTAVHGPFGTSFAIQGEGPRTRLRPSPMGLEFECNDFRPKALGLGIEGDDVWNPKSFFLFGIGPFSEDNSSRPVVPLMYLPVRNLGTLSGDPNEGRQGVVLPLAPPDVPLPLPPVP